MASVGTILRSRLCQPVPACSGADGVQVEEIFSLDDDSLAQMK